MPGTAGRVYIELKDNEYGSIEAGSYVAWSPVAADIGRKVVYVMPHLGDAIKILKNKAFFICCIVVLVLIMLNDIRVKKRKLERKKIREKYEKKSKFFF